MSKNESVKQANSNIENKEDHLKRNKRLLILDVVLIICAILSFIILCVFGFFIIKDTLWQILLIAQAVFNLLLGTTLSLVIQTKIGTYKCKVCGNTFNPTFKQVLFTLHFGSTKHLNCSKCNKKTWHKKIPDENL
ncbi:MAG: hypothetical protein IJD48_00185 [Clostridia bacterium]|nr:hypothetical protein [Clostridia bacterium]